MVSLVRRNVDVVVRAFVNFCAPQHLREGPPQHHTARHGDLKDIGAAAGRLTAIEPAVDTADRASRSLHCWLRPPNAPMHLSDNCIEVDHVLLRPPNHHFDICEGRRLPHHSPRRFLYPH